MNGSGNDKIHLVRTVYEQHCSHARHLESLRLWLTMIITLLLGGSLLVMGNGLSLDCYSVLGSRRKLWDTVTPPP
jgi:hypothetical protein